MSGAEQYVTKEEFDSMQTTVDNIRTDVQLLTTQVAEIAEDLSDLRVEVNELRVEVNELRQDTTNRFEKLETTVVEGNAALMSAILQIGKR